MAYPQEAIDKCERLYASGRRTHEQIEEEMRRDWPDWSRKNLYGPDGWIERYGFEDARRRYRERTQAFEQAAEDATDEMLRELLQIRRDLYESMQKDAGGTADPQKIYAYDRVTKTLMQLLKSDSAAIEPVSLDSNDLYLILMEIPEIKDAIEKHKKEILEKIERA